MADVNVEVSVFHREETKPVAKFSLNGYNIASGGVFGQSGAMRSFKVLDGDIWEYWERQTPLEIRDEEGRKQSIRVFAAPADEGAMGLVEFL